MSPNSDVRRRPCRIGYDASSTVGPRTGIGAYAAELLTALGAELPEPWRVRALVNSGRHPLPEDDPWIEDPRIEVIRRRIPGRLLLRGWQHLRFPPVESLIGPLDLYHSPASYVTPRRRAPQVLTVHDLFFLRDPQDDDPFGGAYFKSTFPRGLKSCARVIAVSEFTRRDLNAAYGYPLDRISVVYHGVDHDAFGPAPGVRDREIVGHYARGEPYVLCIATLEVRRKNIEGLVRCWARNRESARPLPRLLIVGKIESEAAREEFERRLASMNLGGRIALAGYVPRDHLPPLYRGAAACVVPSLNEGFGLPALEAMACGCPVAAASAGAIPEVVGDAGLLEQFDTPEQIERALNRLVGDAALRERLREAGLRRAAQFTWRATARATIDVYARTLEEASD